MQNNINYQEIVQTVTSNILEDIKSQLASMQPGIVDDIVKRMEASIQPSLDSFTNQLGDIQQRLSQLEQQSGSSTKISQVPVSSTSAPPNTSSVSPTLGVDPQASTLLLLIQDWPHIVHNGWIIYADPDKYSIFMVRENGVDNTNITDLFKFVPYKFNSVVENGSDWIIKYNKNHTAVIHMS